MQLRYSLLGCSCRWLVVGLALCCLSCSGGPKLNPVKGTLLYHDKPLADATVTFHLEDGGINAIPATAFTDQDGAFELMTGDKEGAQAGKYKVTVICPEQTKFTPKSFSMGDKPEVKDRFKGVYANAARSQITEVVENGPNEFTINLK